MLRIEEVARTDRRCLVGHHSPAPAERHQGCLHLLRHEGGDGADKAAQATPDCGHAASCKSRELTAQPLFAELRRAGGGFAQALPRHTPATSRTIYIYIYIYIYRERDITSTTTTNNNNNSNNNNNNKLLIISIMILLCCLVKLCV